MKAKIMFLVAVLSMTALLSTACTQSACDEDCGYQDDIGRCECA